MKKAIGILCLCMLVFSSCQNREDKEEDAIIEYIENNNLDALSTSDGLYYVIEEEGTGDNPTIFNNVEVHDRGYTLENEQFDSSYDRGQPSEFPLSGVTVGWQLGIPLFKEGGSGKLIIRSRFAYGKNPPAGSVIGKNEVLVFDIELINVFN